MEKTVKEPRGYYVEKGSFFAHAAVTILVLAMAARLLATMNLWGDMNALLVRVVLPVGCSLLFILFILLLGRIALWTTILPVLGGAAFFVLSLFGDGPGWPLFICIALAFLAAFLYTATLTGMIRGKWLLVLVFALILAYQIVFRAIPVFGNTVQLVTFVEGMDLLSLLGMVFAMLLASISFRRKKAVKVEEELPKIKDPVVIPPTEEADGVTGTDMPEAVSAASEETADLAAEEFPEPSFDPAPSFSAPEAAEDAISALPQENSQE